MVVSVHGVIRPQDEKEKFVKKETAWEVIFKDEDPSVHTDKHLSKGWKQTGTRNLHDQLGR